MHDLNDGGFDRRGEENGGVVGHWRWKMGILEDFINEEIEKGKNLIVLAIGFKRCQEKNGEILPNSLLPVFRNIKIIHHNQILISSSICVSLKSATNQSICILKGGFQNNQNNKKTVKFFAVSASQHPNHLSQSHFKFNPRVNLCLNLNQNWNKSNHLHLTMLFSKL
jgi:hypothetical protein